MDYILFITNSLEAGAGWHIKCVSKNFTFLAIAVDTTTREEVYRNMLIRIAQHLPVIPIHKTCSRCGHDFGALGREYTCPACRKPSPPERRKGAAAPKLSFREMQIVGLIRQAKSNKEIAFELCLTVGTVKEYIYHIFRKLGVKNRTELALWQREEQAEAVAS